VYHYREDTFFLRRLRVADDVVSIPHGMHLDDSVSAALNYADQPVSRGGYAARSPYILRAVFIALDVLVLIGCVPEDTKPGEPQTEIRASQGLAAEAMI
jgi:hypothetical protein